MTLDPLPTKPVAVSKLAIRLNAVVRIDLNTLLSLGVTISEYKKDDYRVTQEIGDGIAFLERDGLLAPSARWNCENLMVFDEHVLDEARIELVEKDLVDWQDWARQNGLLS